MWARLHLFATSLYGHLSTVSLCRILPPHHAAAARRAFPLAAGGTGHAPSGSRAACRTPACAGCASLLHWLRAGKLGRATNLRLLRLARVPHQLAQPSRKPHTLQSARPLFTIGPTLVPWPLALGRAGIRQPGGSAACACCLALPHTATAQHGYRACHAPRAIGNFAQRFLRQPCVGTSRLLGRKAAALLLASVQPAATALLLPIDLRLLITSPRR